MSVCACGHGFSLRVGMPSTDSDPEMHLPITVTNRSVLDWGHAYHLPITVTNRSVLDWGHAYHLPITVTNWSVLGWGHTYPTDSHPEIHFSMTVIERSSPRVGVRHRNPSYPWQWQKGSVLGLGSRGYPTDSHPETHLPVTAMELLSLGVGVVQALD